MGEVILNGGLFVLNVKTRLLLRFWSNFEELEIFLGNTGDAIIDSYCCEKELLSSRGQKKQLIRSVKVSKQNKKNNSYLNQRQW